MYIYNMLDAYTQVSVTILASRAHMAKNETPEKHRGVILYITTELIYFIYYLELIYYHRTHRRVAFWCIGFY